MKRTSRCLILMVMTLFLITSFGYSEATHNEIQVDIQKQYYPYQVIKPMTVWKEAEYAARFRYYTERLDELALKRLKEANMLKRRTVPVGSLIEVIQTDLTVALPCFNTISTVMRIRVKGDLGCIYVSISYFDLCTEYIGIGSNK